jgi:hypothetical protein
MQPIWRNTLDEGTTAFVNVEPSLDEKTKTELDKKNLSLMSENSEKTTIQTFKTEETFSKDQIVYIPHLKIYAKYLSSTEEEVKIFSDSETLNVKPSQAKSKINFQIRLDSGTILASCGVNIPLLSEIRKCLVAATGRDFKC